jgi:hypothetical protein
MILDFAVRSLDEKTFWQSWIDAKICTAPYVFTPEYPGIHISDQTTHGWVPVDKEGGPVPGWHCNVRVVGPLVDEMTYGLEQFDKEGNLLSIFARTWATHIFQLKYREKDEASGFPAGYRNETGVSYCDIRDINTPTNGWV